VAAAIARGATNREAGTTLFLSPKTIEMHLSRVYRKLGLRSRAELANWAATAENAGALGLDQGFSRIGRPVGQPTLISACRRRAERSSPSRRTAQ